MNSSITYTILFFFLAILFSFESYGQKTDTIVHVNGNILTGDFKKLNSGVVTWKMDGMGTINVEEPKISTIISSKIFEIKMESGHIYFGSFEAAEKEREVNLVLVNENILVKIEE